MTKGSSFVVIFLVGAMVLFLGELLVTAQVTCDNVNELSSCAPAILLSQRPSQECCVKLKEKEPCICEYLMNPFAQPFVNSPRGDIVFRTCGVTKPTC